MDEFLFLEIEFDFVFFMKRTI